MDDCSRCAAVDAALADPETRIYRSPDGDVAFVTVYFEGDLLDVLPDGARELVPRDEPERGGHR